MDLQPRPTFHKLSVLFPPDLHFSEIQGILLSPLIKPSPLEYWLLLQHCLSEDAILSFSFELTFLVIARSDSIFKNLFLSCQCHFSILANVVVNLFWYSSNRLKSSSLVTRRRSNRRQMVCKIGILKNQRQGKTVFEDTRTNVKWMSFFRVYGGILETCLP